MDDCLSQDGQVRTSEGSGAWADSHQNTVHQGSFELEKFHEYMLVPPKHPQARGFLCFDGFELVSMSSQAGLIETAVCFLDIFLVLDFPLPSVNFFLSPNLCENSFVITRKKEKEKTKNHHLKRLGLQGAE